MEKWYRIWVELVVVVGKLPRLRQRRRETIFQAWLPTVLCVHHTVGSWFLNFETGLMACINWINIPLCFGTSQGTSPLSSLLYRHQDYGEPQYQTIQRRRHIKLLAFASCSLICVWVRASRAHDRIGSFDGGAAPKSKLCFANISSTHTEMHHKILIADIIDINDYYHVLNLLSNKIKEMQRLY